MAISVVSKKAERGGRVEKEEEESRAVEARWKKGGKKRKEKNEESGVTGETNQLVRWLVSSF